MEDARGNIAVRVLPHPNGKYFGKRGVIMASAADLNLDRHLIYVPEVNEFLYLKDRQFFVIKEEERAQALVIDDSAGGPDYCFDRRK